MNPGSTDIIPYTSEALIALRLQSSFPGLRSVFNGTYVIYISLARPGNLVWTWVAIVTLRHTANLIMSVVDPVQRTQTCVFPSSP